MDVVENPSRYDVTYLMGFSIENVRIRTGGYILNGFVVLEGSATWGAPRQGRQQYCAE